MSKTVELPQPTVLHPTDQIGALPMHSPPLEAHLSALMQSVPAVIVSTYIEGDDHEHHDAGNSKERKEPLRITPIDVVQVISAIADSCAHIAKNMRFHQVTKRGGHNAKNEFGDEVLSVDELAEGYIRKRLSEVPAVKSISSEEHPDLRTLRDGGCVCVTYDPLDGSSCVAPNFAVGSIFGIWPGTNPIGLRVSSMIASVVVVYGPRTTMFVAHKRLGVFEYMLFDEHQWGLVHKEPIKIGPKAQLFAPGNLRAAKVSKAYQEFVAEAIRTGKTLRYTGAMVPDVMQILVKKQGIFATPVAKPFQVKLRMCFEVAPVGFMCVCAGGRAFLGDGSTTPIMAARVTSLNQKSSIVVGSAETVDKLIAALAEEKNAKSKL